MGSPRRELFQYRQLRAPLCQNILKFEAARAHDHRIETLLSLDVCTSKLVRKHGIHHGLLVTCECCNEAMSKLAHLFPCVSLSLYQQTIRNGKSFFVTVLFF